MRPIFLIGYMGVGKSSVGRALARKIGAEHIDLDWWIEQRFRCTISDMFATIGEDGFRRREHAMLEEVVGIEDVVVSAGGGTPCFFDNMKMMKESGLTVYLKGDVNTIVNHVTSVHSKRPLLKGKSIEEIEEFVKKNLYEREPYYMQAEKTISVTNKTIDEIIKEIEAK